MPLPKRPKNKVLTYARVSSLEQSLGTSLKDQQVNTARVADALGKPVHKAFVEAESGGREKLEKRTAMRALLAEATSGDLVLCDKIDRWSRDPEFTYRSIRELREKSAAIYFVSDDCDPETSHGDDMLGQRVLFARMEHKRIRERMVGTRHLLQAKGFWVVGRIPFGYRRPKGDGSVGRTSQIVLEIVPEEAEIIRRLFTKYIAGASDRELAEEFGMAATMLTGLLVNRTYLGEMQLPPSQTGKKDGDWIKAMHPAIITRKLFDDCQAARKNKKTGGKPGTSPITAQWLLRGIVFCALCQKRMICVVHARDGYWRCRNKCGPFVLVEALDEYVAEMVLLVLKSLRETLAKPATKTEPKKDAQAARDKLARKRARVLETFADGDMTRDERRAALAKIDASLNALAEPPEPSALVKPAVRAALLKQLEAIESAWWSLSRPEMGAIVRVFVAKAYVAADREPNVKPSRWSRAIVRRPILKARPLEEIQTKLDDVRATLLRGLGQAPSVTQVIDALVSALAPAKH